MKNLIFNQVSKTAFRMFLLLILGTTGLQAQSGNYRCFCDASLPDGILGFEINVTGSQAGETWTVDNVINLYSNINPNIPIQNGTELTPDVSSPDRYMLTGYAIDGQIPFVTILNSEGDELNVNMLSLIHI